MAATFLQGACALPLLLLQLPAGKPTIGLVGVAALAGGRLRLTPPARQTSGAAWFMDKKHVRDGFEATFSFQITQPGGLGMGADGFAFVMQNAGPDALAGRGSAGGFALGDGQGRKDKPGIPRSVAVFFDTHRNGDADDPSDNYVAICTNGAIEAMKWPPKRLGTSRKIPFRLKDGKVHLAKVRYKPPMLSVSFDDGEPSVRAAVDLRTVIDEKGDAFIGFTASTGEGFEIHDILTWSFTPTPIESASSDMFVVQSNISFLHTDCLEGRNLCTPPKALVEQQSENIYHVVLPAHIAAGASIPNPSGLPATIHNLQGIVCWDPKELDGCIMAGDGASVVTRNDAGRTSLRVATKGGNPSQKSEGYLEFDVRLGERKD